MSPRETEYETAVRLEREVLWLQRQREARGAEERAEALLMQRLGRWHARLFHLTGCLWRDSKLWPGTHYLIRRSKQVEVVKQGRVVTKLCVIPREGEPEADRIMSILDLIETDERRLWEMANVFPQAP